jgi:hypothetical protein
MIDFYSLFAILLAFTINKIVNSKPGFLIFLIVSVLIVGFNQLQTYQYYKGILHHDSMTFEKYRYVFLKTSEKYMDVIGSDIEPLFVSPTQINELDFFNDLEKAIPDFSENNIIESDKAFSGRKVAYMNDKSEFSPTLVLGPNRLIQTDSPVYVEVSLKYNLLMPIADNKALVVYAATNKKNQVVFYKTFRLLQLPSGKINSWNEANFGFKVSAWDKDLAQVKVYVWNPAKYQFLIDDLKVKFLLTNEL